MSFLLPIIFTAFQLTWSFAWAALHVRIRKGKAYSINKKKSGSNVLYRAVSPILFLLQLTLPIACVWADHPALLEFHSSDTTRMLGAALMCSAMFLYAVAVKRLGAHYSPCYDTHLPTELVTDGVYRFIRHPMYAAKILVGIGTLAFCGSGWFVPGFVYLCVATWRAMHCEEVALRSAFPEYSRYAERTKIVIPGVF